MRRHLTECQANREAVDLHCLLGALKEEKKKNRIGGLMEFCGIGEIWS